MTPGTRLGAYEIVSVLGRGGMGEVYRARDLRLGREVAIKILPEVFAADPERSARFTLEAKVLAALNHPNIGAIYGLEESEGSRALVLELVEGPTLAERIAEVSGGRSRGLDLDEALSIADQIADALETAHEQGVVHRDLKPANVKLRPDGRVKVLDFGLAKLLVGRSGETAAPTSESPTMTSPTLLTARGVLLGTAGYMSPEQARGAAADRRSDVWALGCVLYEMLAGRAAFVRGDVADTLVAVLSSEPDWDALPPETPPAVRRLLRRALEKDPRRRLPEVGSARLELEEARVAPGESAPATAPPERRRGRLAWTAAALAAAVALGVAAGWWLRSAPAARDLRVEITTPPTTDPISFAISPDGTRVAYVASIDHRSRLWLRSLESGEVRALEGTEGASYPFWSPDGRSLGFFARESLNRIDLDGSAVSALAPAPLGTGGTWNADGVIVYALVSDAPLSRVPAAGGATVLMPWEAPPGGQRFPHFLPDGRHFLYYVADAASRGVYLGELGSATRKRLLVTDSAAVYAAGELFFCRGESLYAQPFDLDRLEPSGSARRLAERVARNAFGAPAISVSSAGPYLYRTGAGGRLRRLVWVDRRGEEVEEAYGTDPDNSLNPALSPDEERVALSRTVEGNTDIWMLELARRLLVRFTFEPGPELYPVWAPDGREIVHSEVTGVSERSAAEASVLPRRFRLVRRGGESAQVLVEEDRAGLSAVDWSATGWLLYRRIEFANERPGARRSDLLALPVDRPGEPVVVAGSPFDERSGGFSPDGRWVAYASDESGQSEVFVQRFPGPGQRLQLSTAGGMQPRWRPDGTEVFYLSPESRLMAVRFRAGADGETLEAGSPEELFAASLMAAPDGGSGVEYAISRDGQRFLLNELQEQEGEPLRLVAPAAVR